MLPEKLINYIKSELTGRGCQLVNVAVKGSRGTLIEIVVDKEVGITLDECSDINKKMTEWISVEELFGGKFTLDVCSPGLDRIIRSQDEYVWAQGKNVAVNVREAVQDKRKFNGKLIEGEPETDVVLETEKGAKVTIDRHVITSVKLTVSL